MPAIAAGGELSVRVAAGLMVIVTGAVMLLAGAEASFAATLTVSVPAAVGMPAIEQLLPSVRPVGSVPEATVQV